MTEANKILTVSYGTFSCTLEGFDDPFTTMKAIAEYFRDLAADDRYFGAEPPTPDAAMLHRIAEREVQRRVEAKIDENGITLRTGDAASPMVTEAAPVVHAAPLQQAPAVPTVDAAIDQAATDEPAEESVAARLLRLRRANAADNAAAATTAVAAMVAWDADDAGDLYEDEHFEAEAVTPADEMPSEVVAATEDLMLDVEPDLSDESAAAEPTQTAAEILAAAAAELETPDAPAPEMVVVVHEQVRPEATEQTAVIARYDAPPEDLAEVKNIFADTFDPVDVIDHVASSSAADIPSEGFAHLDAELAQPEEPQAEPAQIEEPEPEAASFGVVATYDDPTDTIDEADIVLDAVAEAQPEEPADDADMVQRLILGREDSPRVDEDDTPPVEAAHDGALSDLIATMSGDAEHVEVLEQTAPPQHGQVAEGVDAIDDLYFADALPEATPAESAELVEDLMQLDGADADDVAELAPDPVHAKVEVDDELTDAEEPAPHADLADAGADLADDDTQLADEDDEDDDLTSAGLLTKAQQARARVIKIRRPGTTERPTMLGDAGPMPAPAEAMPSLSDAAEAELMAELAAAEAATDPDTADGDKDADVARLMRQADTEMAGPENRRRLSAIAHLKAAVAATIADRRIGRAKGTTPEDARIDPYRDDLARVVGSQQASDQPAPPPVSDRPAPLVLVSEQRIDRPKVASTAPISAVAPSAPPTPPAPVVPVRPRRIVANTGSAAVAEPLVDAVATPVDEVVEPEDDENFDDAAIFADPRSFSEFAERLGAEDLPSLLQAAAAYAMEVEEMPSFTRPQLLRQIEAHGEPGDFQREDVLRSFGQLLRTGDFIKKRRGQYALQDGAPILQEARKLGGEV